MDGYELLDVGGAGRLERFGAHITDRPHGGALGDRREPGRWSEADLRFDRDAGWSGPGLDAALGSWTVRIADLILELRPTEAGQVGLFPEHAGPLPWLRDQVARRATDGEPIEVLNLFAYTGLTTLALAAAGARVTHVDAARPSVAWARRNASANDLGDHPVRWIVDDARSYSLRELRRGRRYAGIVLDPPTYGHGAGGSTPWRLDEDLPDLLATLARLILDDGFIHLTAHREGLDPRALEGLLADAIASDRPTPGHATHGDLGLTGTSGAQLDLGAYVSADLGAA